MSFEQCLCFYRPNPALFTVSVIVPMLLAFLGLCVFRKIIPSHFLNQSHDVTGPFFSTLGTVYGIFLAFIVSTTWQEFSNTQSNLVQEARYLADLYSATKALPQPTQGELRMLLRKYRDSVITDEWKTMARGNASEETQKILEQISEAYMRAKTRDTSDNIFLNQSIQGLSSIAGLRASRIDDSSSGLLPVLWIVLLVGGSVTVGFTFLFGAHNFKAQALMTVLLTGVICMSIFIIINLDFPFTGDTTVSPEAFQNIKMEK